MDGMFLIQAIEVRRELVKPLPRYHTRYPDQDTQSSTPIVGNWPQRHADGRSQNGMNAAESWHSDISKRKRGTRIKNEKTKRKSKTQEFPAQVH